MPDRHQIWHTEREYEKDGRFVYDFMLKSNIDVFLCDVISLLAQVVIVSSIDYPKRCL